MRAKGFSSRLSTAGSAFALGLGLGLGLGLLYVPCAGPVLAAITVAGVRGEISADIVVLTLSFALGTAVPLLVFALAGRRVADRVAAGGKIRPSPMRTSSHEARDHCVRTTVRGTGRSALRRESVRSRSPCRRPGPRAMVARAACQEHHRQDGQDAGRHRGDQPS
ncbi:cytochrome c biogenesis CcdA family protein [Streptomyces sp. NPDC088729]|uniref:cytochrome c biogenesis CcdA family protein n=1 Tax=Streptomyces sp. NPDC088729 TaxID=3365876 RepID=UPI00382835BB